LTPNWQTLEGFVQEALSFSSSWRPSLSVTERLLAVGRAWEQAARRPSGAGLLHQLDRFQRDCQAVGETAVANQRFAEFNRFYQQGLDRRGRFDRMTALRALTEQIRLDEALVIGFLTRFSLLLFDGFHRFEPRELDLVIALAKLRPVAVWLVGTPGQSSSRACEFATDYLQKADPSLTICDVTLPAAPLADLGRCLFPAMKPINSLGAAPAPAGLSRAEAPTVLQEIEQIAADIKADLRRLAGSDCPLRLADIAVVIPGPAYDAGIREVMPRAGLSFNLAGRALNLARSRPARLVLSALEVIRGQWRSDLLLDFLMQPIVKRNLERPERLHELFEERPRQRQRLDYTIWSQSWQEHLRSWKQQLGKAAEQTKDDEDVPLSRLDREALEQSTQLVHSLDRVLAPVAALEGALASPKNKGDGFLAACIDLLQSAGMNEWLRPPSRSASADPALWAEYEKDQQAYACLLALWQTLAAIPAEELPKLPDGQTDWMRVATLALANETYQIRTDDDAGVQVFEIREIRGLTFRHVYMLGLIDGQFPSLPEEGALADLRREQPALARQLELKEAESEWLFAQLFEAAQEKLVLSRPCREGETPTQPSSYLLTIDRQVKAPALEPPGLCVDLRSLYGQLGRRLARVPQQTPLDAIWPGLNRAGAARIEPVAVAAGAYRRVALKRNLELDLPLLLPQVLSDRRAFSPSELEKYAACPFRFFGTRLLKLQEREPDTTRLQYGSFVHRVLEKMYICLREQTPGLSRDDPLPPVGAQARVLFSEIFNAEWQAMPGGLLPRELSTLFKEDEGVVESFVRILKVLEEENDLGNLCTEYEFKNVELGLDREGRPVLLNGIVDRVDLDRGSPTLAYVFDYKTGVARPKTERQAKSEDGRLLQLALYGHAVGKSLGKHVVGAAYLYLNERRKSQELSLAQRIGEEGELRLNSKKAPSPFELERARQKALELASDIRAGVISLTSFSEGKYSECTDSCPMRSACRQEVTLTDLDNLHETTIERK
jgi:RecB family exonuclease